MNKIISQGNEYAVEEIVKKQYDEYPNPRPIGKVYPEHVTEWNYISKDNMTIPEYTQFLKDNGIELYGYISFRKFRIKNNNEIYYRHVAYERWID